MEITLNVTLLTALIALLITGGIFSCSGLFLKEVSGYVERKDKALTG